MKKAWSTAAFAAKLIIGDILFALNEMTHPGEKRMQSICRAECRILPENFDRNLNRLFDGMFREPVSPVIREMIMELDKIMGFKEAL